VHPGHHRLGREVRSLLRRPALAVDGGAGHGLREAGGEDGVAAQVHRLGADLGHAAEDHVLDELGVEVVALDEGPQDLGAEVDGVPARQVAVALAEGRADGIDDHGAGHGVSSRWARRGSPLASVPPRLVADNRAPPRWPDPPGVASGPTREDPMALLTALAHR
jgi:hypothetical protein